MARIRRFGVFELDIDAGKSGANGLRVKLQPQPFRLLVLLTSRPGSLITRDEIRSELWPEGTFVAFDQAVNFAIKQIRTALEDSAERPIYLETVPRQAYRFVAPVDRGALPAPAVPLDAPITGTTTARLQKVMWANLAELRARKHVSADSCASDRRDPHRAGRPGVVPHPSNDLIGSSVLIAPYPPEAICGQTFVPRQRSSQRSCRPRR